MKEIKLTQGKVALVDDEDFEYLSQFNWSVFIPPNRKTCYAARGFTIGKNRRSTVRMHREIMKAPPSMQVDHRDGNGLNNQKENLRVCTASQNRMNEGIRKDSTSGYRGVHWVKGKKKWKAVIVRNRKFYQLGYFPTKELGAAAYNEAAKEIFGEFAVLNKIEGAAA